MKIKLVLISILIAAIVAIVPRVAGQTCSSEEECNKLISEYEAKLGTIREQKNTLSSQIQFADTQVYLTTLRIQDAEAKIKRTGEEIENISAKIDGLNSSLDHVSKLLIEKIAEGYKRRDVPFLSIIVDSEQASVLANRLKYAKTVEENDRRLAFQVQQAKLNFQQQKELREKKQQQLAQLTQVLEDQKLALDHQKVQKKILLERTQNDEAVYQQLLAKARAEYNAIRVIVSGGGSEKEIRQVEQGERIASIISGSSACSNGTHLHFETVSNGSTQNPAQYLSSKNVNWDLCGIYGCDPEFSFNGSMAWPINDQITITQPFGETTFARGSGRYPIHTGIDMFSSDYTVKSTLKGKLFQGSYACGGGYLTYVKVIPDDGGPTTYYLHVNY